MYYKKIQDKTSTDSFGLGFFLNLLNLVMPIIQKENLFQKLDFDFSVYVKELLPEFEIQYFSNIENIQDKLDDYCQEKQYGTTTYFFFFLMEAINTFFMPLLKKAEFLSRILQQIEKKMKQTQNKMQQQFMQIQFDMKKAEFILYKILLEDVNFNANINLLYNKLIKHYLNTNDKFIVPQHYFLNYVQYQVFEANIIKDYYQIYNQSSFQLYLQLLQKFLSPEFKNANKNLKVEFVDLLFTLNITDKERVTNDILEYFKEDEQLSIFVLQILDFYSNIEFLTDHDQSGNNKFRYRYFCSKFLNEALQNERYIKAFKQSLNSEEAENFLGNILTDLNYFIESVFEGFPKIKELEEKVMQNQFQNMNLQNQNPQEADQNDSPEQQLQMKKSEIKNYLQFGQNYLKLFEKISSISPEYLNSEQWADKVVQVLNYYALKMCSKSYIKYKFKGINELGFQPLQFIKVIISIYYRISDCQLLKEEIVKDERSYSQDVLIDIGTTAMKKKLVSWEVLQKFEKLIKELEFLKIEKEQYFKIFEDFPDEFECPLSCDIMSDPVRLPDGDNIVDYKSIKKQIVISGPINPFNRQKLSLDEVEHLPELKKKIENWKKQKIEEWKQKNQKNDIKLGDNLNTEIEYEDEEDHKESTMYNLDNDFQL